MSKSKENEMRLEDCSQTGMAVEIWFRILDWFEETVCVSVHVWQVFLHTNWWCQCIPAVTGKCQGVCCVNYDNHFCHLFATESDGCPPELTIFYQSHWIQSIVFGVTITDTNWSSRSWTFQPLLCWLYWSYLSSLYITFSQWWHVTKYSYSSTVLIIWRYLYLT